MAVRNKITHLALNFRVHMLLKGTVKFLYSCKNGIPKSMHHDHIIIVKIYKNSELMQRNNQKNRWHLEFCIVSGLKHGRHCVQNSIQMLWKYTDNLEVEVYMFDNLTEDKNDEFVFPWRCWLYTVPKVHRASIIFAASKRVPSVRMMLQSMFLWSSWGM